MNSYLLRVLGLYGRIAHEIQRRAFSRSIRARFALPPVEKDSHGPIVVSMVSKRDLQNYLVAIRTFSRSISPSRVIVLDGGRIDESDATQIRSAIPFAELISVDEVDLTGLQRGGTWERLALIAHLSECGYVIQLDADTLTLGELSVVGKCIDSGTPFVLRGDRHGSDVVTVSQASERAARANGSHVQTVFEQRLSRFADDPNLRYIRGCSAFTGFPQGSITPASLRAVFARLQPLCEDRWKEWGTEQITANFILANLPDTVALSPEMYATFTGQRAEELRMADFIHFIGTYRYRDGIYVKFAKERLQALARV